MTSKPSTGAGGGGGGDGGSSTKEKRKWNESKVYSRKSLTPKISSKKIPSSKTARFDSTTAAASDDDSSSLNRRQQFQVPNNRDPPSMDGFVMRSENRVTINISSGLKQDLRELRRKLSKELDQVRNLVKKLEAKEIQLSGYSHSQLSTNYAIEGGGGGGGKRGKSKANLHRLSLSAAEESQGGTSEIVQKEKRGPKTNQYYPNSEFLNGKEKTPLPPESNKKAKINGGKKHGDGGVGGGGGGGEGNVGFGKDKHSAKIFKSCNDLLTKLMKHKHGWVFNTPVDVKGLGLRDYFIIIKHPMDLGTVKARLSKHGYKSPMDFAEDVKLTFHNAMTYNRKGQDVHIMAEELLKIFEDKWAVIQAELNQSLRIGGDHEVDPPHSTTKVPKKKNPLPPPEMRRTLDRSESTTRPVDSQMKSVDVPPSGKNPPLKKPKVNDINKRDMTYDEKQRLSTSLQSLPLEKLDNIVQIIKNRNSSLFQNDDEIEVDIDSVDVETLWELDRFVTNYKKGLSKNKKKAETAIQQEESEHKVMEMDPAPTVVEAPNETETVFNANEKNVSSLSPVQGEKQGDVASRSSSSSSSSSDSGSSSSDSDSDSSSASDT